MRIKISIISFLLFFKIYYSYDKVAEGKLDIYSIKQSTLFKKLDVNNITDSIPNHFFINIPYIFLQKKYSIKLEIIKGENNSLANIQPCRQDTILPSSFFDNLIGGFGTRTYPPFSLNYLDCYQFYKKTNFFENSWIAYRKINGNAKYINICDINGDGIPEIIEQDLSNDNSSNPTYDLFHWNKKENKFVLVPDFFNHSAFYGWDKTLKYMITGYHDRGERHLIKNKVINYELIAVDSTDVSDAEVFNKW